MTTINDMVLQSASERLHENGWEGVGESGDNSLIRSTIVIFMIETNKRNTQTSGSNTIIITRIN